VSRATQSLLFAVIYSIYLVVVMGPVQGLILRPLCALLPSRRSAIVRWWLRLQAGCVLNLARVVAGFRLGIEGALPRTSCIVLMNHQSLLDVPVGVSLMPGPPPLIPTRAGYARGIPGISGLIGLAEYPLLSQGARLTRSEHQSLVAAADRVARGERSFLIFPEGHRSHDGQVQPFMVPGLRLLFGRAARRPVYLAAVDGFEDLASFPDIARRIAGTRVRVAIRGPYAIPADAGEHAPFVDLLRNEMIATLAGLRAPGPTPVPIARPQLVG
jgi:1-acyl-sn-glycerol-3-phosphate acyltransferase